MPRLPVALQALDKLRASPTNFLVCFINCSDKFFLQLRGEFDDFVVLWRKHGHNRPLRKGKPFNYDFSAYNSAGRYMHTWIVPEPQKRATNDAHGINQRQPK